jgi:hypothetical protein
MDVVGTDRKVAQNDMGFAVNEPSGGEQVVCLRRSEATGGGWSEEGERRGDGARKRVNDD